MKMDKLHIGLTIYFLWIVYPLWGQEKGVVQENLPYYPSMMALQDPYLKERCQLDLYIPNEAENFSTIVWFHGGGLTGGNKYLPKELLDQGFAVVAVNYRLHPQVNAAKSIVDAATAVSWVIKNISEYGGNPSKIFVSGHSAGGYLALMVGMDSSYLQAHGMHPNQLAGLIPFSGHTITHFTIRKEMGLEGTQPLIDPYAPLFFVRKDSPPILLITGDRELELLGRYEENAYFYRMMKVVGHSDIALYELDGYGHSMTEPAFPLLLKWIKSRLRE